MTTWLTPERALEYVTLPVTGENLRLLRVLGHKKKVRWTKMLGYIQYDQESLDEYREQKARGKTCAASQNLSPSETKQEESSPPTGISTTSTEAEVSAYLRGIELARKTMKQGSRSPNSSSKGSAPNHESRASL